MGSKVITSAVQPNVIKLWSATFMLKATSNGPLPQLHSLPSNCLLYCLGAYQGYLLHLPDLFLMLWLVNNLVESLFLHQPPGYLSLSSTRLSAVVLVFYIFSTCIILELICICTALQWSDRSVSKSASQPIISSMLNHPCFPLVHPWLSPLPVILTNLPHVFQMS